MRALLSRSLHLITAMVNRSPRVVVTTWTGIAHPPESEGSDEAPRATSILIAAVDGLPVLVSISNVDTTADARLTEIQPSLPVTTEPAAIRMPGWLAAETRRKAASASHRQPALATTRARASLAGPTRRAPVRHAPACNRPARVAPAPKRTAVCKVVWMSGRSLAA